MMITRSTKTFLFASSLMLLIHSTYALLNSVVPRRHGSIVISRRRRSTTTTTTATSLFVASSSFSSSSSSNDDEEDDHNQEFMNDFQTAAIETTRKSLEESNLQRRLKSRPVKLPYDVARKWVQANLGVDTKEEFEDFVMNGKLRTPYIPKRPEEYYKQTKEWISWDHFLLGMFDKTNPSRVAPATGIFD